MLAWLLAAHESECVQIEALLSCLLSADAADIERSWQAVAHHKEGVIADVADRVLLDLVSEVEEIVLAKR